MKISRRSWHYRLYRFVRNVERSARYLNPFAKGRIDYDAPSSLCPYAWSIFLGLVGVLVLTVAVAVGGAIALPFYWAYLALAAVAGVLRRIDSAWKPRHRTKRPKKESEPRPERERHPSVLAAYVRARKERVCPTIELVD